MKNNIPVDCNVTVKAIEGLWWDKSTCACPVDEQVEWVMRISLMPQQEWQIAGSNL